jgi:hypothetical protein
MEQMKNTLSSLAVLNAPSFSSVLSTLSTAANIATSSGPTCSPKTSISESESVSISPSSSHSNATATTADSLVTTSDNDSGIESDNEIENNNRKENEMKTDRQSHWQQIQSKKRGRVGKSKQQKGKKNKK